MALQRADVLRRIARAAGIDVEVVKVYLSKGEQRTKEYRDLNPLGKIPFLVEDGFSLAESASILRYLANTNQVEDHWYPADPKARARVDSAMDWHHSNVRQGAAPLALNRVLAVSLGRTADPEAAARAEALLVASLKMLERFWLKDRDFVAGPEISIADLLMTTELEMLHILEGADEGKSLEQLLAPFPAIRGWMQRVAAATAPHYQEAHRVLMRAVAHQKQRKAERQRAKL